MYLRDVQFREGQIQKMRPAITLALKEAHTLEVHYTRYLPKVATGDIWRFVVSAQDHKGMRGRADLMYDIANWIEGFDYDGYAKLEPLDRKEMALAFFHRGVVAIAKQLGIDPDLFKEIPEQIRRDKFENNWFIGKTKWQRKRKRCARLWIEFTDEEEVTLYLIVWDTEGSQTHKVPLCNYLPHYEFVHAKIAEFIWLDEFTIEFRPTRGRAKKVLIQKKHETGAQEPIIAP